MEESQRVEEDDEVGSNPDELLTDDGEEEPEDGEDLMGDNWKE